MIKAFIFDLDGTLVNTEKMHYRAWRRTLQQNGVAEFSFEMFMAYVGTSNEKVATDFLASHAIKKSVRQLVQEKQTIYMQLISEIEPFDGTRRILSAYHGKLEMAIASSSHKMEIVAILENLAIKNYFKFIIGGDMVEKRKPDPEIYLKASSLLSIPPNECLAFEDSVHGLAAAKNAGMMAIAIPNEFTQNHDFRRADVVLESLVHVDDALLETLSGN